MASAQTKKRILIPLSITAAAVIAIITAFIIFYKIATMDYSASIKSDVDAEIKIMRNEYGLPLIEAETMNDVFFALGYVHSQDRLASMEYYRMLASGSAKDLLKEDGAMLDHIVSTAGIRSAAIEIVKNLPAVYREYLDSYVNGINSIRPKWRKFISSSIPERQWESRDIIAVLLLREWSNSFLNNKELLLPMPSSAWSNELNRIIPPGMQSLYSEELSDNIQFLKNIRRILETHIGYFCRGFVFSIPADTHLEAEGFNAFSLDTPYSRNADWYPVNIKYSDIYIQGITCAGLPFIFAGKKNDMSFYSINLDVDTQDFILEEIKTVDDTARFLSNGAWKEFIPFEEPVFPEGSETIWYTANGPVINTVLDKTNYRRGILTMRHTLPKEDYLVSLFELPLAEGTQQIAKIVKGTSSPPKVYFLCEKNTSTSIYNGMFPFKTFSSNTVLPSYAAGMPVFRNYSKEIYSTKYALVGSALTEALGNAVNSISLAENSRYERLNKLINTAYRNDMRTAASVKEILTDITVPWAEKFVPIFMRNLSTNPTTSARLSRFYLKKWDFTANADSVAPTLFHSILLNYIDATFVDEAEFNIDDIMENHPILIMPFYNLILSNSSYFDDKRTEPRETPEEIFDRAFLKTIRECSRKMGPIMDEWHWGKFHKNDHLVPFKKKLMIKFTSTAQEDSEESGGGATIYNNGIDFDLSPKNSSSLLGFFASSYSEIAMDFSYSLYPLSKFYSNNEKKQNFIPFDFTNTEHTDVLYINETNN